MSTVRPAARSHGTATARRAARGHGLIEVLISLLVLCTGLLGVARLQAVLWRHAEVARDRGEAARLARAQADALAGPAAASDTPSSGSDTPSAIRAATRYTRAWRIAGSLDAVSLPGLDATVAARMAAKAPYRTLHVDVAWVDRGGQAEQVALDGVVARDDGGASGALALDSAAAPATRQGGTPRHPGIPVDAMALSGRRSAVLVPGTLGLYYVLDDLDGTVVGQCEQATAPRPGQEACNQPASGVLVGGYVHVVRGPPSLRIGDDADTTLPLSAAAPLHLELDPRPARAATCHAERRVRWRDTLRGQEVTLPDTAPAPFDDRSFAVERYLTYLCLVPTLDHDRNPLTPAQWSGRLMLVPDGWALGLDADSFQVCRYTGDADHDGLLSNAEHPLYYRGVSTSLAQQNFLIVEGPQTCPAGDAQRPGTVAHQPSATLSPLEPADPHAPLPTVPASP